eukprot:1466173-Pyramimonas_sp.AAC.1
MSAPVVAMSAPVVAMSAPIRASGTVRRFSRNLVRRAARIRSRSTWWVRGRRFSCNLVRRAARIRSQGVDDGPGPVLEFQDSAARDGPASAAQAAPHLDGGLLPGAIGARAAGARAEVSKG